MHDHVQELFNVWCGTEKAKEQYSEKFWGKIPVLAEKLDTDPTIPKQSG